ncbi:MAG: QueT transporter family protein [Ruthenibacterium sp.]
MKHNTKRLVRAALIAGIYVALCLVQQPLAYGPVQFRVSEALTLLPIFTPDAVWAVTMGCFLSNLFSMSPWDMLFGTLATLTAAQAAPCAHKGPAPCCRRAACPYQRRGGWP